MEHDSVINIKNIPLTLIKDIQQHLEWIITQPTAAPRVDFLDISATQLYPSKKLQYLIKEYQGTPNNIKRDVGRRTYHHIGNSLILYYSESYIF